MTGNPIPPRARHPGEIMLPVDPDAMQGDAHLVFIGRIRSPWNEATPPPKNPNEARARGGIARLEIDEDFRPALKGLERFSHLIVIAWLHRSRRDALVVSPPHAAGPRGVFALRSPVRPNPIGLSVARIIRVDPEAGIIDIDAIDFLDGTPLVDLKPYRPGIDAVPDAVVG
ncbi:MAG: tRNA (N6-threonylcarbamoyladenosine(37)-N6)-methyltransferase TrmO [Hyphomicrobiaceae bacterium]